MSVDGLARTTAVDGRVGHEPARPVLDELVGKLAELIEVDVDELDVDLPLINLGADSIILMEAMTYVEDRYAIEIRAAQLVEELNTLDRLAAHIESHLTPPGPSTPGRPRPEPSTEERHGAGPTSGRPGHRRRRTDLHAGPGPDPHHGADPVVATRSSRVDPEPPTAATPVTAAPVRHSLPSVASLLEHEGLATGRTGTGTPTARSAGPSPAGASGTEAAPVLTDDPTPGMVEHFGARMGSSKRYADRFRPTHADARAVTSLRRPTKEVTVPLVAGRAAGPRIWDLDGRPYLDLAMGFGSLLLGHGDPTIQVAVAGQLEAIGGVGPSAFLAGPLSQEIGALTGQDRVSFVTTGTEAVMLALRLARSATGRRRVAIFRGAYHGWWEGTLALPGRTYGSAVPGSAGSIGDPATELTLLGWDDPRALDHLRAHGHELAAVLAEPVQSRRPGRHCPEFLAEVRSLAAEAGALLVFDEIITGFRLAPGGAAELFGVRPDLAIYGKALGGGLPMACVAGRSDVMDLLDGGAWRYGDDSLPVPPSTFSAGTFAKHPLSMAASWAFTSEIRRRGPGLYRELDERSARFEREVNAVFDARGVEARLERCGSMMRIMSRRNLDALFAAVIAEGVYLWEGRTMFLSTTHGDDEISEAIDVFDRACVRLGRVSPVPDPAGRGSVPASERGPAPTPVQDGTLRPDARSDRGVSVPEPPEPREPAPEPALPPGPAEQPEPPEPPPESAVPPGPAEPPPESAVPPEPPGPPAPDARHRRLTPSSPEAEAPPVELPLTPNQAQLSFAYRSGMEIAAGFHTVAVVDIEGPLDVDALDGALDELVRRHDSMRTTFDLERGVERLHTTSSVALEVIDLAGVADGDAAGDDAVRREVERACSTPFDLRQGPLWRIRLIRTSPIRTRMVLASSDLVADGVSFAIILREFAALYDAAVSGTPVVLDPAPGLLRLREWLASPGARERAERDERYWAEVLNEVDLASPLPPTRPASFDSYLKGRAKRTLDAATMERVGSSARLAGTTKVSTLLATFAALIHRLGGRDDFVLGIPTNARSNPELRSLVAMLATPVAIRIRIEERTTVRELLRQTQRAVFDAMDRPVAIDVLARHEARRTGVLAPVTPVMFNFDPIPDLPPLSDGVRMRIGTPDRRFGLIPFSAEACPTNDGSVNLSFDSSASMYDPEMVECWVDYFVGMLDRLPSTLDEPVSSLPLGGPGA